jgi:hypothetical protein
VQVETGSESSSPRTPPRSRLAATFALPPRGRRGGGDDEDGDLPQWLTEWRLKAALASQESYEVHWKQRLFAWSHWFLNGPLSVKQINSNRRRTSFFDAHLPRIEETV